MMLNTVLSTIFDMLRLIDPQIFLLSALLFFVGYAIAPTAYYKKIHWLTVYPFFIIRLMDKYFKKDWPPLRIFSLILVLNTFSLFINLMSGWGIILPFLFAVYMGLNIGVVMYHTLEGKFYFASLINPVALIELPASWISIAIAIQFSLARYFNFAVNEKTGFNDYLNVFLLIILPLLIVADVIETFLIVLTRKKKSGD